MQVPVNGVKKKKGRKNQDLLQEPRILGVEEQRRAAEFWGRSKEGYQRLGDRNLVAWPEERQKPLEKSQFLEGCRCSKTLALEKRVVGGY